METFRANEEKEDRKETIKLKEESAQWTTRKKRRREAQMSVRASVLIEM